eukprot:13367925-Ditylum_brightwellii.AAC.1
MVIVLGMRARTLVSCQTGVLGWVVLGPFQSSTDSHVSSLPTYPTCVGVSSHYQQDYRYVAAL